MVNKSSRTRLLGGAFLSPPSIVDVELSLLPPRSPVVDVCRTLAAAPGPFVTGRLISIAKFKWVFVISGAIKVVCASLLLSHVCAADGGER